MMVFLVTALLVIFALLVFMSARKALRIQGWIDDARYIVGIDMGFREGSTSIVVVDTNSGQVINEFRPGGGMLDVKQFARMIIDTYDPCHVSGDVLPCGAALVEDWRRDGIMIDPVRITKQSKMEMLVLLKEKIDRGDLTVPRGVADDADGEKALMIAVNREYRNQRMKIFPVWFD